MHRRLGRLVATGYGLIAGAMVTAVPAHATAHAGDYTARLVQLVNNARENHGLAPLELETGTSSVATNWTGHMSDQRDVSDNPHLGNQLAHNGSPDWTACGEDVGTGATAEKVFHAYMNSPPHRANILDSSYVYVGVGVVHDGRTNYNTLDFVNQYSARADRRG